MNNEGKCSNPYQYTFKGRMRRMDYFGIMLVYVAGFFLIGMLKLPGILLLVLLATISPYIVKRLNDADVPWWTLVIPPLFPLIFLLSPLLPGNKGPNAHGPDPRTSK